MIDFCQATVGNLSKLENALFCNLGVHNEIFMLRIREIKETVDFVILKVMISCFQYGKNMCMLTDGT